jgi:hypothetical protein
MRSCVALCALQRLHTQRATSTAAVYPDAARPQSSAISAVICAAQLCHQRGQPRRSYWHGGRQS